MRIAVEDITTFISVIAGMITGLGIIAKFLDNMMKKWATSLIDPLNQKIDKNGREFTELLERKNKKLTELLEKNNREIHSIDIAQCRNFITRYLADIERGEKLTEIELERFNDIYSDYEEIGGNSYIHSRVEKLKKQGKL